MEKDRYISLFLVTLIEEGDFCDHPVSSVCVLVGVGVGVCVGVGVNALTFIFFSETAAWNFTKFGEEVPLVLYFYVCPRHFPYI